jgi:hypothetical protein
MSGFGLGLVGALHIAQLGDQRRLVYLRQDYHSSIR